MKQFEIYADTASNRLYCLLKGYFLNTEIELAGQRLIIETGKLQKGFDAIIDVIDVQTPSDPVKDNLKRKLEMIKIKGVRFIFRVNGKQRFVNVLGKINFLYFKNLTQIHIPVSSVNEAEELLSRLFFRNAVYRETSDR